MPTKIKNKRVHRRSDVDFHKETKTRHAKVVADHKRHCAEVEETRKEMTRIHEARKKDEVGRFERQMAAWEEAQAQPREVLSFPPDEPAKPEPPDIPALVLPDDPPPPEEPEVDVPVYTATEVTEVEELPSEFGQVRAMPGTIKVTDGTSNHFTIFTKEDFEREFIETAKVKL